MSYYRLTVIRVDDNPRYDEKRAAEYAERQKHGYVYGTPYTEQPSIETRALDVVLTDAEYETIRRAVVDSWR